MKVKEARIRVEKQYNNKRINGNESGKGCVRYNFFQILLFL